MAVTELATARSNPGNRWKQLVARLRDDRGIGLVELLIALLVLNIGIFATLAAFTSGALAIRRASHVSTAAAIADKQMEAYRDTPYASLPVGTTTTTTTGADGRTYTVQVTGSAGTAQSTGGSSSVTVEKVTVYDGAVVDAKKLLDTSSSTFSRCTQAALNPSDTTPCQS